MDHDIFENIYSFRNPENNASCSLISHEIIEIYENFSSENTVEQKTVYWNAGPELLLTNIPSSSTYRNINIDPTKVETTI